MRPNQPYKNQPFITVPRRWKLIFGEGSPFSAGAKVELVLVRDLLQQWSIAVIPKGEQVPTLLGTLTKTGDLWWGNLRPDGGTSDWFLALSLTQRPENGEYYLFGMFLQPANKAHGGDGQVAGTWGAEEDDGTLSDEAECRDPSSPPRP